ncbi:MAG: hypothetical protein WC371_05145 [Parachlamydiales bacterium]
MLIKDAKKKWFYFFRLSFNQPLAQVRIKLMEVERELKDLNIAPYDHKKIDKKIGQLLLRLFP